MLDGTSPVLSNISFSQKRSEKIAIAGETGSGKTSLLKIIAGLIQPDQGEVVFNNEKVKGPDDRLVPGHPSISFLSQHFELAKSLRVEQVLTYANNLTDEQANELFQVCQIDHLLKRRTDQLSGGEKQRIAIARLLIGTPELLLLDEPFSHLDMVHKNTLKAVINDICDKLKITCILVSHDPHDTLSWADKIIIMRSGRILQNASPEKIYANPVDEYTAGLFGNFVLIEPQHLNSIFKLKLPAKKGKKIMLRPERFSLAGRKERGIKGEVVNVAYYGNYYEADVVIADTVVTIQTAPNRLEAGSKVNLKLKKDDLWYL
jgi:ABC-type sulfate/molybdate transport systems ATPase subunit